MKSSTKRRKPCNRSTAQILMVMHLKELGYERIVTEYQFHPLRRWRADIAVLDCRLLIECDGYYKGKHGTGWGNDDEKSNVAQMLGFKILRFNNRQIENGEAKKFISTWMGR